MPMNTMGFFLLIVCHTQVLKMEKMSLTMHVNLSLKIFYFLKVHRTHNHRHLSNSKSKKDFS